MALDKNRYRRAFQWRIQRGQGNFDEEIAVGTRGLANLIHSEQLDVLEDLLYVSRKRRDNWTAIVKLQLFILQELAMQEASIRSRKAELKKEGANSANEQGPHELFADRAYANCLRMIVDGIVWRALRYDRAATRVLSARPTKQNILADGAGPELSEFGNLFNSGALPILNSLSNTLAHGDVTAIHDDGSVELVEVKSSNVKSRRINRQKEGLREIVSLFNCGEGRVQDGTELELISIDVELEHGLDLLKDVLEETDEKGFAAKRINNCCYVQAFDPRVVDSLESVKADMKAAKDQHTSDWQPTDFVIALPSYKVLQFTPNCAPFSVFPFSDRTCVDLMTGAKFYTSYFNFNAFAREFTYRGWSVEKTPSELIKEGSPEFVLVVAKQGLHAYIPTAETLRLHMELLRPQTLIKAWDFIRTSPERPKGQFLLPIYKGEGDIWN